ncbi:uncharacterized protein LOC108106653 [Drosophila eugracilis]|uniref:uncharacterized protein LOC108106653 n=1 Tax=Drosophila eugracilis TaxID=29029 RepID=UPI0007E87056|nr:uncharacterized protein LOC108106653 [Drosophila eugracilis]
MPGQYTNYKCTRLALVLLRCIWAMFYLWGMLHAAAIMPIPYEHLQPGLFTKKRIYIMDYRSLFDFKMSKEISNQALVLLMMFGLFRSCRCSFVGSRNSVPKKDNSGLNYWLLIFQIPYIIYFLFYYAVSILITLYAFLLLVFRDQSDRTLIVACQVLTGMIFKLLVLANFYMVLVRIWAYLNILHVEAAKGKPNYGNFGDHLNLFFRL